MDLISCDVTSAFQEIPPSSVASFLEQIFVVMNFQSIFFLVSTHNGKDTDHFSQQLSQKQPQNLERVSVQLLCPKLSRPTSALCWPAYLTYRKSENALSVKMLSMQLPPYTTKAMGINYYELLYFIFIHMKSINDIMYKIICTTWSVCIGL